MDSEKPSKHQETVYLVNKEVMQMLRLIVMIMVTISLDAHDDIKKVINYCNVFLVWSLFFVLEVVFVFLPS